MVTLLPFHKNNCAAVTQKFCALKEEEHLNSKILVLFSFL